MRSREPEMTRKADMTAALVWEHAIHDVPQSGLSREREAAPDELARIARTLDLLACTGLKTAYTIVPTTDGRYRLSGRLHADISQACVVTLEPVETAVDEEYDVTFWPEQDMPPPSRGEVDLDEEAEPEPIMAGQIDAGRVVFECLAASIDPFPRKPEATLDQRSSRPSETAAGKPESPFAVLANLKPKS
jgi:uncharacterized metal-binding protein YceD (DUF177 family)